MRPPEARQKPKVSSFLHARYEKIDALAPDLILAFSDLQADITTELVKRGYPVFTFNQRSVAEILQMIRVLGGIVGVPDKAEALAASLEPGPRRHPPIGGALPRSPAVYFEEWDDPLISGIRWVEELVEIAGGTPVFPELRAGRARPRIGSSPPSGSSPPRPRCSSARGAASRCGWRRCGRAPAGARCRSCATIASSR